MAIYLTEELAINILQRVPVKTLLLCRSVCKTWYTLISSSHFISTHLNFNKNSTSYLLFGYSEGKTTIKYVSYYDIQTFDLHTHFEIPFESVDGSFYIHGSINGLICLKKHWRSNIPDGIILWNPIINKALFLPQAIHEVHDSKLYDRFDIAFGFDSTTNDYKVLRILYFACKSKVAKVEVYRLSTGIWEDKSDLELPYKLESGGVNVHESEHWFGQKKKGKHVIVLFDMHSEVFGEIELPAHENTSLHSNIYNCNGLLCMIVCYDMKFDIWLMKEYGVVESWIEQYSVDLKIDVDINIMSLFWRPLGFRKNGDILLPTGKKDLISYNLLNKIVTNIETSGLGIGRYGSYDAIPDTYMESLVLLDDERAVNCDTSLLCTRKSSTS